MTLCEHHKCTGCGVCQAVCHKDAISFTIDELGFRYPVIDKTRCIECGSCIKICPSLNPIVVEGYDDCYLAWAKDDTIHYESASGGISTVLNKHFINGGGFAIGCSWDAEFNAVLAIIESDTELKRTRGSKYVMSYIANTVWGDIKKRTQKGQKGLVIGLPCQVAAIKSFTKDDENILFVDLICKGGCSPACLKTHLSYLKKRKRLPNITDIRFRGGDNDCYFSLWNNDKIVYKKNISQDPYFYSFMKHGLFRESCYQCQYATSERVSDITIADFWGIDSEFVKDKNTLNGTNLVIVHSDKGRRVWDEIISQIDYYRRPIEEAIAGNDTLREPTPPPSNRDELITFIRIEGFEKALRHDPVYRRNNNKLRIFKGRVFVIFVKTLIQILPSSIYNFIKKTVRKSR